MCTLCFKDYIDYFHTKLNSILSLNTADCMVLASEHAVLLIAMLIITCHILYIRVGILHICISYAISSANSTICHTM